jgi:Mg/Co/Ni transporter MgtE
MGMAVFMRGLEEKAQAALFNAAPQGKKTEVKNKVREMLSSAQAVAKEYADGIKEAIQNQDVTALIEYKSELDANTKRILMPLLDSDEIKTLKEIKGE